MQIVYLIVAGTALEVSRDGGEFAPQTIRKQLQFDQPVELSDEHALFSRGPWRFRAMRKDVIKSVHGGGYLDLRFANQNRSAPLVTASERYQPAAVRTCRQTCHYYSPSIAEHTSPESSAPAPVLIFFDSIMARKSATS